MAGLADAAASVSTAANASGTLAGGNDRMMRVGGPGATLAQPPPDEPLPNEWWKRVPPQDRDWWTNRLNKMPNADPESFRDDIARTPMAPGAFGDRMNVQEQEITRRWIVEGERRLDRARGFRPR